MSLLGKRSRQGIINIVFATGSAAGAPLGGIMSQSIGWRWCLLSCLPFSLALNTFYRAFLIQVPAAIIAIISVSWALKLPQTEGPALKEKLRRIDFAGAAALISTTFALLIGLDRGSNLSWNDPYTIASLMISLSFLLIFALIELKWAKEPFAPKHIIVNSSLLASYLTNFFGLGAALTLFFEVSLYFQAVLQKTSFESGLFLLPVILCGVSGSLIGGLIMQVTGKYYVLTVTAYALLFFGHLVVYALTENVNGPIIGLIVGMRPFFPQKTPRVVKMMVNFENLLPTQA
jgi:MFS family permease